MQVKPLTSAALPEQTGSKRLGIFSATIRTWPGRIGLVVVLIVTLSAAFAPWVTVHDPNLMNLSNAFKPPSTQYWLGTDQLGRDLLTRMVFGGRLSLWVGIGSVLLGIVVGVPLGLISGISSPRVDAVLMRGIDILLAMPALILAMAVIAILGSGITNIILAIGVRSIPIYARVTRAQVLVLRERDFVVAAQALGASQGRVLVWHILPNLITPVIAISGLRVATAILTAASLTFLGLGVPPGAAEWGAMLNEGRQYIRTYSHLVTYPGLMIMLSILGFNLLGDGLQDAMSPRLRSRIGTGG